MAEQKQDDQLEYTYSSYVRIRDVALNTCQRQWTIGRSGERGSGISVLGVRHDDDDDDSHLIKITLTLFKKCFLPFTLILIILNISFDITFDIAATLAGLISLFNDISAFLGDLIPKSVDEQKWYNLKYSTGNKEFLLLSRVLKWK